MAVPARSSFPKTRSAKRSKKSAPKPTAHTWRALANFAARVAAIVILTLVVYIPAMSAGFLWDDDQEITGNASLQNAYGLWEIRTGAAPAWNALLRQDAYTLWEIWTGGLTNDKGAKSDGALVKSLRVPLRAVEKFLWPETVFKTFQSEDYFPLKTTMLWLEFQLWGRHADGTPDPGPFHVMNILLHAIDALLIWLVLSQLKVPGAWLAGLLFAIHPVHVESVAWIAERKNTLSLLFYLLSISAWLKFEGTMGRAPLARLFSSISPMGPISPIARSSSRGEASPGRKFYLLSLLFCLAALLCKTSVVVLPAVLLLCSWWRTGRLTRRDWLLAAPFFILSIGLAEVTVWFQNARAIGQEVIPIGDFWSRLAGAGFASWWYLEKAFLPLHLNTIYNAAPIIPPAGPQLSQFIKGAILLILLFGSLTAYLRYDKQRTQLGRTPFFVLAYFLGTLFPVLGFFKMSYMRVALQADHFQYLSDIAIVAAVAAGIAYGWEKANSNIKPLIVAGCVLLVGSFSAYSWQRAAVHQSEKTLWSACLEANPDCWQAHNHLGVVLHREGDVANAFIHYQRAVSLKPGNALAHNNLALTLTQFGRSEEALAEYREAVRLRPNEPGLRSYLANCLVRMNRLDEAAKEYQTMVAQEPTDPEFHFGYGALLIQLHRLPEAQEQFEQGLKLDPGNQRARQGLEAVRKLRERG